MKTQTTCILLAIVIILILGYAAFNGGKLWGSEQENYHEYVDIHTPFCYDGKCDNGKTCKTWNGYPRCL